MGYKHNIDDILDVGSELIRKNGYHNVGINQILKECDIPKGSFYNFFESKEDFVEKIVTRYGSSQAEWLQTKLKDDGASPLSRLKALYALLIDYNEMDNFAGGCLVNTISNEVGRSSDDIAEASDLSFQSWLTVIAECIELGQKAKEIRKDISSLELAEYIHAGMYGGFARMKVTRDRSYLDKWFKITFNFIEA